MKERRKHKRYYLKALLQANDEAEYSNVTLESINISAGGLLMRASAEIDSGATFTLLFSLPGRSEPVKARCEAVHSLEAIPGKQYFIGARFLDLEGISEAELDDFLKDRFEESFTS